MVGQIGNEINRNTYALTDTQWNAVLAKFDKNGDGKINKDDKITNAFGQSVSALSVAKQFAGDLVKYDADKNGDVTQKERFQEDYNLNDTQWDALVNKYDINGDGKIQGIGEDLNAAKNDARSMKNFDINKDGEVTQQEINDTHLNKLKSDFGLSDEQMDVLKPLVDKNGDGNISFNEMADARKTANLLKKVDSNKDGKISESELKDIFDDFDSNGNGKLGKNEREALANYLGIDIDKDGLFNKYKFDDFLEDFGKAKIKLGL